MTIIRHIFLLIHLKRKPSASCILITRSGCSIFGSKTLSKMKKQERISRQEEMTSLIESWQESGKTQQVFCQEHDLTFSTFYYWLKRYRREINENSFLPVEINSSTQSSIEIRYPDGVILQLPASIKFSVLKQLLSL